MLEFSVVCVVNEQGTTNQALVLGDVDTNRSETLFGIANNQSGTGWVNRFIIQGDGDALFYGTKISGSAASTGSFGYIHMNKSSQIGEYFRAGEGVGRYLSISAATTTNEGDTHVFDAVSTSGVLKFKTTSTERLVITGNKISKR